MRSALTLAALALLAAPALAQTPAPGVTTTAPEPKPAEVKPTPAPEPAPAKKPEDKTLTGAYVYGAEVSSFQPCGDKTVSWLDAEGPDAEVLSANALAVAERGEPYTPIYVTITARPAEAVGEFSKDYDSVLELVSLDDLAWKRPEECAMLKPE